MAKIWKAHTIILNLIDFNDDCFGRIIFYSVREPVRVEIAVSGCFLISNASFYFICDVAKPVLNETLLFKF